MEKQATVEKFLESSRMHEAANSKLLAQNNELVEQTEVLKLNVEKLEGEVRGKEEALEQLRKDFEKVTTDRLDYSLDFSINPFKLAQTLVKIVVSSIP